MRKSEFRKALIDGMREEGMTYEAIGRVFGISKQAAYEIHKRDYKGDHFRVSTVLEVKYIGLREWMLENRVSITALGKMCGVTNLHNGTLVGKHALTKPTIDKILKVTGLTYEECFKEE